MNKQIYERDAWNDRWQQTEQFFYWANICKYMRMLHHGLASDHCSQFPVCYCVVFVSNDQCSCIIKLNTTNPRKARLTVVHCGCNIDRKYLGRYGEFFQYVDHELDQQVCCSWYTCSVHNCEKGLLNLLPPSVSKFFHWLLHFQGAAQYTGKYIITRNKYRLVISQDFSLISGKILPQNSLEWREVATKERKK